MAQGGSVSTQKTKDGERKCDICQLKFPDIYAYTDHLESKIHVKGIMKKKYGPKYLEAKANLIETNAENKSVNAVTLSQKKVDSSQKNNSKGKDNTVKMDNNSTNSETSDDDDVEIYTCKECKKICTGLLSYELHLNGKKHLKTLKRNKALKQMQMEKILPESSDENDKILLDSHEYENRFDGILCKVCNKTCTGPKSFKQHNQSQGHKKKLAAQKFLPDIGEANVPETESDEDVELPAFARCDICSKSFTGPVPYKQHMTSPAHFKQTRHQRKMSKFKDFYNNSDKKIQCKKCNKSFSGPLPFQEHINSAAHEKTEEKNELIKSLQEKYKELIITPTTRQVHSDDSDDDSDSDNIMFSCKVCHTAFSGPQSAQDHFQSLKHKKVVKEKKRLKKLKLAKKDQKAKSTASKDGSSSHTEDNKSDDSYEVINE